MTLFTWVVLLVKIADVVEMEKSILAMVQIFFFFFFTVKERLDK